MCQATALQHQWCNPTNVMEAALTWPNLRRICFDSFAKIGSFAFLDVFDWAFRRRQCVPLDVDEEWVEAPCLVIHVRLICCGQKGRMTWHESWHDQIESNVFKCNVFAESTLHLSISQFPSAEPLLVTVCIFAAGVGCGKLCCWGMQCWAASLRVRYSNSSWFDCLSKLFFKTELIAPS